MKQFQGQPVSFVETIQVKEGVSCDVFEYTNDQSRDLAIVTVTAGSKTPLQKVLKGNKTVEGFLSGAGALMVVRTSGTQETYDYMEGQKGEHEVRVGETMQWIASNDSNLVFYEICDPPYEDGRYENLADEQ